jgi:Flp pilus assembly protein TadG
MERMTMRAGLRLLRRYQRDDRGVVTIFACFIIMMMVLVGGIGVDLMHNEMQRTRLQNTLDRAVLAAADLDQTLDPQAVVREYFDKAGMADYLSSVIVHQGLNYRVVQARATTVSQTQFMHLIGVNQLRVPAAGTAEERISKVEISLVLDISGSMGRNNRMENLQDAAKTFVDKLIREETRDLISISVIPYSEHVNAGREIFEAMTNVNHRHNYSHCIEFPDDNFADTTIRSWQTYDQMQHFQWYQSSNLYQVSNTTCPRRSYEGITPFSQDADELKTKIDRLRPRAQTSIFLGVKWGAALLDPSSRPIVNSLAQDGVIDSVFGSRPAHHNDPDTLKTIVVMTDGRNTSSYRIASWAYNSPSEYEHWSRFNFWAYLGNYVPSYHRNYYYTLKYNSTTGDMLTNQICDAAKAKGIVIWGVGLEVDDHGAGVLKNCASSPSHFFRVEGVEINDAFSAIATQINQLRLTQ